MNNSALVRVGRVTIAAVVTLALFPAFASAAQSVSTRTVQLLPVGGTSCPQATVSSATPYVYNGSLDSFDIVLPDASYVAIGGAIGNTDIPFRLMTRAMTPDGQLRVHVDTDPMSVGGALPISVTLLSSNNGLVCAATVTFTIPGTGVAVPPVNTPVTVPAPVGNTTLPSTEPNNPVSTSTSAQTTPSTSTASVPLTTTSGVGMFSTLCASSGAFELWFILLALYVVIVAAAALTQPPLIQKNPAIPVALILIPLIVLVGFWYFTPMCRAATWVPIVLLIIAIIGLLVAFREQKATQLLLPITQPKPPMPPVVVKPQVPVTPVVIVTPKPITPVTPAQNTQQKPQQGGQQNQSQQKK